MLVGETHTADFLEPVDIPAEVFCRTVGNFLLTELLRRKHIQLIHQEVGPRHHLIRGMESTVQSALLRVDEDDTITSARSINRRGGAILQDVNRFDIVGIEIGQVPAGDTVDDDERAQVGASGGNAPNLDAGAIVRVRCTGILDGNSGHFPLNHHGRVGSGCRKEFLARDMRNGRCQFLFIQGAITDNNHFIQKHHIRSKGYVYVDLVNHRNLLCRITNRPDYNDRILLAVEGEDVLTIQIRTHAIVGPFNHNNDTGDGISGGSVGNDAPHRPFLRPSQDRNQAQGNGLRQGGKSFK